MVGIEWSRRVWGDDTRRLIRTFITIHVSAKLPSTSHLSSLPLLFTLLYPWKTNLIPQQIPHAQNDAPASRPRLSPDRPATTNIAAHQPIPPNPPPPPTLHLPLRPDRPCAIFHRDTAEPKRPSAVCKSIERDGRDARVGGRVASAPSRLCRDEAQGRRGARSRAAGTELASDVGRRAEGLGRGGHGGEDGECG